MDRSFELPPDPTRKVRRAGIRATISAKKDAISSVGKPDLTTQEIALEARRRVDTALPSEEGCRCALETNLQ